MLWVLKRTVSMRRFFWAPKTYVKTDGYVRKYLQFYAEKMCLSKPVDYRIIFIKVFQNFEQQLPKIQTRQTQIKLNNFLFLNQNICCVYSKEP